MTFLAELELVSQLEKQVKTTWFGQQSKDADIDSISVNLGSLRDISQKYGASSKQFKVALSVFDAALFHLHSQLQTLYHNQILTEIVFLGEDSLKPLREQILSLLTQLQTSSSSSPSELQFDPAFFPSLFLSRTSNLLSLLKLSEDSSFEVHQLAGSSKIGQEFKHTNAKVYEVQMHRSLRDDDEDDFEDLGGFGNTTNTTGTITTEDLVFFQICLWVPITVAIVLFVFLWAFYDITTGKPDSILYRASAHHPPLLRQ
jgi:hypothetical protein